VVSRGQIATDSGTETRCSALIQRYGELLSLEEVAFELKMPSAESVRKAHERGRLPIPLVRLPGRRGYFALTRAVADLLDAADAAQRGGCHP
jgi:hypothetical protein